jgi:hypothetical protein
MRKFFGVASLVTALVAGVGLSAGSAGAAEEYDEAKRKDFWPLAASAADFAVYKPTKEGLQRSSLQWAEGGVMGLGSTIDTVCAGQWTVFSNLKGRWNPEASAFITQAPSTQCMLDDRAGGGAPNVESTFKASGKKFTLIYRGCDTPTPEGQPELAIEDCPPGKGYYDVYGKFPAAGGKKGPSVRVETDGMTRPQIRSLVRSMVSVL